jgi:RNA polymerase sigma-70 factor, ECF subfamily
VLTPDETEGQIAAEIVRRIQSSDPGAEEELVARFSRGLLFHLRRLTGDPALAEDLHQETFRIALPKLRREGLAEPERLGGYLLRIGRNLFLGGYRRRTRRGEDVALDPEEILDLPDVDTGQLSRLLKDEELREVRRLIAELGNDRDRQILFRFYVAEEDKQRICADLGLTSLNFNSVLFRARQRLKELLERAGVTGR